MKRCDGRDCRRYASVVVFYLVKEFQETLRKETVLQPPLALDAILFDVSVFLVALTTSLVGVQIIRMCWGAT